MHHTNLNTLKCLVKGAKIRLFNSFDMTDRSEVQAFFELLSINKMRQKSIGKKFGDIHISIDLLGSYVMDS